jgi:hypothetical protein
VGCVCIVNLSNYFYFGEHFMAIRELALVSILFLATSCGVNQTIHIQQENTSGDAKNNRWDYFTAKPVHYTSATRTVVSNNMMVINEQTDAFSANVNIDKMSKKAVMEFSGKIINLTKASVPQITNWFESFMYKTEHTSYKDLGWSDYFISSDGEIMAAVHYEKQLFLLLTLKETSTQLLFYPSRYLACKKISALQVAQSEAMARSLLQTALVAGVQSYTSYSYADVYDSYGNFGYATIRDYSWAGDRASDAISTVFDGDASSSALSEAWDSLSCY